MLLKKKKQHKLDAVKKKKKNRRQSQWHPAWASVAFIVTPGSTPVVFTMARDLVALRRNPIRSIASWYQIVENHKKSMVLSAFSAHRITKYLAVR